MSTPTPRYQWRREATTCSSTPRRARRQGQITHRRAGSALKPKRPRTAIGRKSDASESTVSTTNTVSSEDRRLRETESKYGVERRQCIEKCLLWMETLPDKFSGMHLVTPQVVHDDDS